MDDSSPPLDNFDVRQAVDIGESFLRNVTEDVARDTRPVVKGTPQVKRSHQKLP